MRRRGHPVLGAFAGFFLGVFLAMALLVFSVVRLDSIVLVLLPVALLLLGALWGAWAPLGRGDAPPAQVQTPPPAPPAPQAQ